MNSPCQSPSCEEIVDMLLDYVGGELSAEQVEIIKGHLCGCKSCDDTHVHYRHTIRITRTLVTCDPLPPAFEARLRKALS